MTTCNPYSIAKQLCDQLAAELQATRAGAPTRMTVLTSPQAAVMEFCGAGWVAFGGISASNGDGGSPGPYRGTPQAYQLALTMGVYRCFPVEPNLGPPPVPALDSASRDILDDFEAMKRAAQNAWADDVVWDDLYPVIGNWRPVTPQGGGHGSTMDVTVMTPTLALFCDEATPPLPGDPRE